MSWLRRSAGGRASAGAPPARVPGSGAPPAQVSASTAPPAQVSASTAPPPVAAGGAPGAVPVADALADAGFVVGLGLLGLVGFHAVYGGVAYLVVGLLGLVLGAALATLGHRWRQPVLAEVLVAVVAFLLLGGVVAAPGHALGGVVPTPTTWAELGHVLVAGWQELLTTAPPVGSSADLLAIPFVVGLVGGVAGQGLARRSPSPALALAGPGLVLALGILFGARHPESLVLQGPVFVVGALAWMSVRHQRARRSAGKLSAGTAGAGPAHRRVAVGAGLLVLAGLAGAVVGPHLPGASAHGRVVLSRYVVPPFEANHQASPLAGVRQYEQGGARHGTVLFTVHGAPPGSLVRIATMDRYDGIVWGFGGTPGRNPSADGFLRTGTTVDPGGPGRAETVTVRIAALGGVWVPDVGQVSRIAFSGPNASQLGLDFRYNPATSTAAEPAGLRSGDRYTIVADVPAAPASGTLASAAAGADTVPTSGVPAVLTADAATWSAAATSPWGRVQAIAQHLRTTGYFSAGTAPGAATGAPVLSRPGHSEGRLAAFLEGGGLVGRQIVGDDEQYAATFALMANAVGVPARVVLGAQVPAGGVVTGADVHAWVDVSLAGLGWVPVTWQAFEPTRPAQAAPPTQAPQAPSSAQVAPPVVAAPPPSPASLLDGGAAASDTLGRRAGGFQLPAWVGTVARDVLVPLALVALAEGTVVELKRRRRRQRRRAATTSAQIAGAWAELVDRARDCGLAVPGGVTRREQAGALGGDGPALARQADAAVFGAGDPSSAAVDGYWAAADGFVGSLHGSLGRWQRLRAATSLRSLRAGEARRPSPSASSAWSRVGAGLRASSAASRRAVPSAPGGAA